MCAGGDVARLGVGHLVHALLHGGEQGGHKLGGIHRVLHQASHVVDDDARLAADGGLAVGEAAEEQGDEDGEGARVHGLDKGGGGQLLHALGHLRARTSGVEGGEGG